MTILNLFDSLQVCRYREPNLFDVYAGAVIRKSENSVECIPYVVTVPSGKEQYVVGLSVWFSKRDVSAGEAQCLQDRVTKLFVRMSRERLQRLCEKHQSATPSSEPIA